MKNQVWVSVSAILCLLFLLTLVPGCGGGGGGDVGYAGGYGGDGGPSPTPTTTPIITPTVSSTSGVTGSNGIVAVTLGDQEYHVTVKDSDNSQPINEAVVYIIGDGSNASVLILDPNKKYFLRFEPIDSLNSRTIRSNGKSIVMTAVDLVKMSIAEAFPEKYQPLYGKQLNNKHLQYFLENFCYKYGETRTLKQIAIDHGLDMITGEVVGYYTDSGIIAAIGLMVSNPVSAVVGAACTIFGLMKDMSSTACLQAWYDHYTNLGYVLTDNFEIYYLSARKLSIHSPAGMAATVASLGTGQYGAFVMGTYCCPIVIPVNPPPKAPSYGSIKVKVVDSSTGQVIQNAMVNIPQAGLSSLTDSGGISAFGALPTGAGYSVLIEKDGYNPFFSQGNISVTSGQTKEINAELSTSLPTSGKKRIVLSWGENPRDLDLHLWTPNIKGDEYHIYFSSMGSPTSPPYADLDIDDVYSFGPETMTIYQSYPGIYYVAIHRYAGEGSLTTSDAIVRIYGNNGLEKTYTVPTSGSGDWWNICTIEGSTGKITTFNTINNSSPKEVKNMPTKAVR